MFKQKLPQQKKKGTPSAGPALPDLGEVAAKTRAKLRTVDREEQKLSELERLVAACGCFGGKK